MINVVRLDVLDLRITLQSCRSSFGTHALLQWNENDTIKPESIYRNRKDGNLRRAVWKYTLGIRNAESRNCGKSSCELGTNCPNTGLLSEFDDNADRLTLADINNSRRLRPLCMDVRAAYEEKQQKERCLFQRYFFQN